MGNPHLLQLTETKGTIAKTFLMIILEVLLEAQKKKG